MKITPILAALLFVFGCASTVDGPATPVPAERLDESEAGKRLQAEFHETQALAREGDMNAQLSLASHYALGRGVASDDDEAAKWARSAAEQGHSMAQELLGSDYQEGKGVPQDYVAASMWHRRAAVQGNASSQYQLGALYQKGLGVLQDEAEAARWFQKAAEQGHPQAQQRLGAQYASGHGVPQNYLRGHAWLNVASANGAQGAAEARDSLTRNMTSGQVADAQKLAREYFDKYRAK